MTRTRGYPTSPNRASSCHLHWHPRVQLAEVAVTLQVVQPPAVPDLYFWALQASFVGAEGPLGAGHLGLQWHPRYPGGTAVNWGGYDSTGQVLAGSDSPLPSALDNPHTRNYRWRAGDPYRLRIFPAGSGWWGGEVTDLRRQEVTLVRRLGGGGDHLEGVVVWSEVFARCDAPPVAVVWSDPTGVTVEGEPWRPSVYVTGYQRESEGGCTNTDSRLLPHGVGQFTSLRRTNPPGRQLPVR